MKYPNSPLLFLLICSSNAAKKLSTLLSVTCSIRDRCSSSICRYILCVLSFPSTMERITRPYRGRNLCNKPLEQFTSKIEKYRRRGIRVYLRKGKKLSGPATPICFTPSSCRCLSHLQVSSSSSYVFPNTMLLIRLPKQW